MFFLQMAFQELWAPFRLKPALAPLIHVKFKIYFLILDTHMTRTTITLALLTAISLNANAATWIRCESCQAPDAYAYARQSGLTDEVVVISLANQMAAKFFNESRLVGKDCYVQRMDSRNVANNRALESGCSYELITTPMALSAEEGGLKGALEQFYAETNGTMKSVLSVNATDLTLGTGPISGTAGGSAYDFVNNAIFSGLVRTRAYAAINDLTISASWGNLARAIVGAGSVLALGADGTKITVVITYSDGSKSNLVFTELTTPDSETSFSAENMPIVDANNQSQFVGQITFNSVGSLNNFFSTLAHYGVPITSTYYQMPGTGSCRQIPNGVACIRPH